jgi:predicted protein tyrosine phosphatase
MNTPFERGTKNAEIFRTSAPYNNPYQGNDPRWLFVCSAGLLRSPTAATMAAVGGINARSCGSNLSYALIPCTANLIRWADKIVFMNPANYQEVLSNFEGFPLLISEIHRKSLVVDIPDQYEYMDPELQKALLDQVFINT